MYQIVLLTQFNCYKSYIKYNLCAEKGMQLTALGLAQSTDVRAHRARSSSGDSSENNHDRLETNTNISEDRRSKTSYTSAGGTKYSSNGGGRFKPRSATRIIAEERARQEKIFEDTLMEYDDENIGDLGHLYDEDDEAEEEEEEEEEEDIGEFEESAIKDEDVSDTHAGMCMCLVLYLICS